jgi:hypothetical protein
VRREGEKTVYLKPYRRLSNTNSFRFTCARARSLPLPLPLSRIFVLFTLRYCEITWRGCELGSTAVIRSTLYVLQLLSWYLT